MHSLLLIIDQVSQVAEQSVASRLVDQAFSVIILFGFGVYMLRKQKQLEDKLEKYMNEDREEMKDVIENNTRAFERIASKLGVFLLFASLAFTSCATHKITTSTSKVDSTRVDQAMERTSAIAGYRERISRDTIITIPARELRDTLQAGALRPILTAEGKEMANVRRTEAKGITSTITALPGGTVSVVCHADELNIQVKALEYVRDSLSSLVSRQQSEIISTKQQASTEKEIVKRAMVYDVLGWCIGIVFVLAILWAIYHFFIKK